MRLFRKRNKERTKKGRVWRRIRRVITGVLLFIILIVGAFHLPFVQQYIGSQISELISDELDTKCSIETFRFNILGDSRIEGIVLKGTMNDTLLTADKLSFHVSILDAIDNNIILEELKLSGVDVKLMSDGDKSNYDFGSDDTATSEDSESSLTIHVKDFAFKDLRFRQFDFINSDSTDIKLNRIWGALKPFDISKNVYNIPALNLDGINAKIITHKSEPDTTATSSDLLLLSDNLLIRNTNINIRDYESGLQFSEKFDTLETYGIELDLKKNMSNMDSLFLRSGSAMIELKDDTSNIDIGINDFDSCFALFPFESWNADIHKVSMLNHAINLKSKSINDTINGELAFTKFQSGIHSVRLSDSLIKASFTDFAFAEKKTGYSLKNFEFGIRATPSKTSLENFHYETDKSDFRFSVSSDIGVNTCKMEEIKTSPLHVVFHPSKFSLAEINSLGQSYSIIPSDIFPNQLIHLEGDMNGTFGKLNIDKFHVHNHSGLALNVSGYTENMLDPEAFDFELNFKEIKASKHEIYQYTSYALNEDDIRVPPYLNYNGYIKGSFSNFLSAGNLRTPTGNLKYNGSINTSGSATKFDFRCDANKFEPKLLLGSDFPVENITATIKSKGQADDVIDANYYIYLDHAQIFETHFYNTFFDGITSREGFLGSFKADDSLHQMSARYRYSVADSNLNLRGKITKYDLDKPLDPLKLLSVSSDFQLNVMFGMAGHYKVTGAIEDLNLVTDTTEYDVKKIEIPLAEIRPHESDLVIDSDLLNIEMLFLSDLNTFGDSTLSWLDRMSLANISDSLTKKVIDNQLPPFHLKVVSKDHPLWNALVPIPIRFKDLQVNVDKLEPEGDTFFQLASHKLQEDDMQIDEIKFSATTRDTAIHVNFVTNKIENKQFKLNKINLSGTIQENEATVKFITLDSLDAECFNFVINNVFEPNDITVNLPSQNLVLFCHNWNTDQKNYLHFKNNILHESNIMMNSGDMYLISSKDPGDPLFVAIRNLDLHMLDNVIALDTNTSGTINAEVIVSDSGDAKVFETGIELSNMRVQGLPLAETFSYAKTYADTSKYIGSGFIALEGDSIRGDYYYDEYDLKKSFAQLYFHHVKLDKLLRPARDQFRFYSGDLNGSIKTSLYDYVTNGFLQLHKVDFFSYPQHVRYKMSNSNIPVIRNQIRFRDYVLTDTTGQSLALNGKITIDTAELVKLDISATAEDLLVFNQPKDDDINVWGTIITGANLKIKGNASKPVIEGSTHLHKGTEIYYRDSEDFEVEETEGLVRFVDSRDTLSKKNKKSEVPTNHSNLVINSKIEIDPATKFKMIILEETDEYVSMTGGGKLAFQLQPETEPTLVGEYKIFDGIAQVNPPMVDRIKFKILEDSYVRWTGPPMNPLLGIRGQKRVKASTAGLTSSDDSYQVTDFDIVLDITDRLEEMQMNMDIEVKDPDVDQIIQQMSPEDRAKQAVSLLLFRRLSVQNGSNQKVTSGDDINRFWEKQLNDLAQRNLKNVDLNFGVQTFNETNNAGTNNSTTSRTVINYNAQKKVFNGRGRLKIGGDLGSTNDDPTTSGQPSRIIGNIVLEYDLDKTSNHYMKVFSKNSYEGVLQGDITQSGVGLVIKKDLDHLKDLFKRTNKYEKKDKKKKQKKKKE